MLEQGEANHLGSPDTFSARRVAGRVDNDVIDPPASQPLPSVDPAFDLAALLDELDASVRPALLSAAFEGFPDDRDDAFAMVRSFLLGEEGRSREPIEIGSRSRYGASRVK